MKFKSLYKNPCFVFNNARYEYDTDIIETDDKELIEFLKQNANFELIEDSKKAK